MVWALLAMAFKAIPWTSILLNAPEIVKAADRLYSSAKSNKSQVRELKDRIAALEKHDEEDAALVKKLADQVDALTTTSQVLTAKLRLVAILALVSTALGTAALAVALFRA